MGKKQATKRVRTFILTRARDQPRGLAQIVQQKFGLSRQTANKHIRALIENGFLAAEGATRARTYSLRNFVDEQFQFRITPKLQEDRVWRDHLLPHLAAVKDSVRDICQYGLTEIVNNAIDHSGAENLFVHLKMNFMDIDMVVADRGVGIFEKIRKDLHLDDPRHALLELSKGKLTTDPENHTGEGIYFSSRLFDQFSILSSELYFESSFNDDKWMIESHDRESNPGTCVNMIISGWSNRELRGVFDRSASGGDDFSFSKTHVPVKLAKYGNESLVSRSQAKRVLKRFDRFEEVMLDFRGVETIGQAFSDEIFRVFRRKNPGIRLISVNTTPEIKQMIQRAIEAD